MPNIGPLELGFIFLLVLIFFGPKALPKIGQSIGRGIKEFKDAAKGLTTELADDDEKPKPTATSKSTVDQPAKKPEPAPASGPIMSESQPSDTNA